jgi:hypothetical protein
MFGEIEKIVITYSKIDDEWTAQEIWTERMSFYGRGKTPEEALKDIHNSHENFDYAYMNI